MDSTSTGTLQTIGALPRDFLKDSRPKVNAKGDAPDDLSPVGGGARVSTLRGRWRSSSVSQKQAQAPRSSSRFSSRLSTGSGTYSNLGDVLREVLNNPEIEYVEVEGFPCSKRMLSEWAVRYMRHSILRETEEQSVQTESDQRSFSHTGGKLMECKPECAEAFAETDDIHVDKIQHDPSVPNSSAMERASRAPCDQEKQAQIKYIIPQPGFCVITTDKASGKKVFVNLCKSNEVSEPDLHYSDDQLTHILANGPDYKVSCIPMSIGEMHEDYDIKGTPCLTVNVIINTKFFEERILTSEVYRDFVVCISIEGVAGTHRMTLEKAKYNILSIRKSVGKLNLQLVDTTPARELKASGSSIGTNSSNSKASANSRKLVNKVTINETQLECDILLKKRQSAVKKTEDKSVQTESEPKCAKPVCADASTETDAFDADKNQSVDVVAVSSAEASGTQQNMVQQQPAPEIPSLMGPHYLQNWSTYYNYYGQQPYMSSSTTYQYQRYEAAKKWKPKDEDQRKALEQAKTDIFNVLVVSKGCAMRNLKIGETLDLQKIGVPNLTTLLVQMEDMLRIKKERYTGEKYIYPNIGAGQFEDIAHIGELVAEQRDKEPMMNAAVQVDCHVADLFEYQQSTSYPHQTSFYSAPHRGSSQHYSYPRNQAHTNYTGQQVYYQPQYQAPSSSTNYQQQQYYNSSNSQYQNPSLGTAYQQHLQQQWLYLQQLNPPSNLNPSHTASNHRRF